MKEIDQEEAIVRMQTFANARKPFIFVISYDKSRAIVEALEDIDPSEMLYDFSGICEGWQNSLLGAQITRGSTGRKRIETVRGSVSAYAGTASAVKTVTRHFTEYYRKFGMRFFQTAGYGRLLYAGLRSRKILC